MIPTKPFHQLTLTDLIALRDEALSSGEKNYAESVNLDISNAQFVFDTITVDELKLIFYIRNSHYELFSRLFRVVRKEFFAFQEYLDFIGETSVYTSYCKKYLELRVDE